MIQVLIHALKTSLLFTPSVSLFFFYFAIFNTYMYGFNHSWVFLCDKWYMKFIILIYTAEENFGPYIPKHRLHKVVSKVFSKLCNINNDIFKLLLKWNTLKTNNIFTHVQGFAVFQYFIPMVFVIMDRHQAEVISVYSLRGGCVFVSSMGDFSNWINGVIYTWKVLFVSPTLL